MGRFPVAFDLLELDGEDLRQEPLERRKARLAQLRARAGAGILFVEHVDLDSGTVFEHACRMGLEGVVSKPGFPLPLRTIEELDQGEEPGEPGDAAVAGRDVVSAMRRRGFGSPGSISMKEYRARFGTSHNLLAFYMSNRGLKEPAYSRHRPGTRPARESRSI